MFFGASLGHTEELAAEKAYFKVAFDLREKLRRVLLSAPGVAIGQSQKKKVEEGLGNLFKNFPAPDEPVAIGRIDVGQEKFYVGKRVIFDDSKSHKYVLSWADPLAQRFHTCTPTDPQGVSLKRLFRTEGAELIDFEDVLLASLAVSQSVDSWLLTDTLLNDLASDRTGYLKDIIATIHASQFELIQKPIDRVLTVQGGPGTGKTVVALHRVAWLLYNFADKLKAEKVLVIGPSALFIQYVEALLPDLGEGEVRHASVDQLGPQRSEVVEAPQVEALKGELKMLGLIKRGLRARIGYPEGEPLVAGAGADEVLFSAETVQQQLDQLVGQSFYLVGRDRFRNWVRNHYLSETKKELPLNRANQITERVWPSLTPQSFLRDLFGSKDRLLDAADASFTAVDVKLLYRASPDKLSEVQWGRTDIPLLDVVEFILNGPSQEQYDYIVVDEAQDLTPMQLESIRRRSRTGWYTLLGDLSQATGYWKWNDWNDIASSLQSKSQIDCESLEIGYRVPKQVMDFAKGFLEDENEISLAPRSIRDVPGSLRKLEVRGHDFLDLLCGEALNLSKEFGTVGVITSSDVLSEASAAMASLAGSEELMHSRGILVIPATAAKGLEFDAVLVADPESIKSATPLGRRLLYIAATRPTRHLTVIFPEEKS